MAGIDDLVGFATKVATAQAMVRPATADKIPFSHDFRRGQQSSTPSS
ncbi:hypothetical protein ACIA74_28215 [Streptomyces sp. NPDC051658]|nr:hypothetical protein OG520_07325 [Streptomyces sp. NBC_00984]